MSKSIDLYLHEEYIDSGQILIVNLIKDMEGTGNGACGGVYKKQDLLEEMLFYLFFSLSFFFPLITNTFRQRMHGAGCLWGFEIASVRPFISKNWRKQ